MNVIVRKVIISLLATLGFSSLLTLFGLTCYDYGHSKGYVEGFDDGNARGVKDSFELMEKEIYKSYYEKHEKEKEEAEKTE